MRNHAELQVGEKNHYSNVHKLELDYMYVKYYANFFVEVLSLNRIVRIHFFDNKIVHMIIENMLQIIRKQ